MKRRAREKQELCQASDALYYEWWMLRSLAQGMVSGIAGQGVINNALLESFSIHARALLDFLYAENPRRDDVIAEDFLENPDKWHRVRPAKTDTLKKVHSRVGKEVAHLTYARLGLTHEMKQWPFVQIANDLSAALNGFLRIVPRQLLGARWNQVETVETSKKDDV